MPDQLQLRGGTTAEHSTFTGAIKEVTVDTTKKTAVVHDGTTAGGIALLRQDGSNSALALGSEGTPSLKWDANTGIFSPGEDQLAIVTGANRAITCTSTQAVGIKTANPNAALHVAGSTRVGADSAADAFLEIGEGATGNRNSYIDIVGDTTYTDYGLRVIRNNTGANATSELKHRGTGALNFTTEEAAPIVFNTTNSPRATIDTSGRLLVGTSTSSGPGSTLQVRNDAGAAAMDIFRSDATTGTSIFGLNKSRGTAATPLEVADNDVLGYIAFRGYDGTTYQDAAYIHAACDGTWTDGGDTSDNPSRLVFSTTADGASSPTERMRLGNSGNADFFVSAQALTVRASGDSTSTINALSITSGATGTTDGTLRFVVETRGNVFNQNNAYGSLSDVKLKENIVDASSQWSDLKNLKVRKYNFKEIPGHTQIGLVAQEVELVSPGLVSESPDRDEEGNDLGTVTKSVSYSVLYMKAVKALQEAMERIEQLESKVAALEGA